MSYSGFTVAQMVRGRASGQGTVPTQTFYAANVAGGPVPKVGAVQGAAGKSNAPSMAGINPVQIALIVVAIIGIGYLLHHLSFQEAVRIG